MKKAARESVSTSFEKNSYIEICTQTPEQLWNYFLNEVCDLKIDDLIIEIFRSWQTY
ncbi:hypothetical protein [Niastella vici]|uniref:hypothetical protein n=1 Tax=Niastella vici TaxID=1703345 RepID=UPI001301BC12|nr:hypothetical protein [Niastella vici]